MLDFNDAKEQKEMGGGQDPIPSKSVVIVSMSVREPEENKKSSHNHLLTIPKNGGQNHYLNCEFEVTTGRFQGNKIWQNFVMAGSEKATDISKSVLRAILESSRNIIPADSSPQAAQARQINSFGDLNGIQFPVMVGIDKPKVGARYINNTIRKVVTPDMEEYRLVMERHELISEEPVPELPQAATPTTTAPPAWGGGGATQAQATQAQATQAQAPAPAWAK